MRVIRFHESGFQEALKALDRSATPDAKVQSAVAEIIRKVRDNGDAALLMYTEKYDHIRLNGLRVSATEIRAAKKSVNANTQKAITEAHANVRDFARRSLRKNWTAKNRQGVQVGERFDPFQRVGIYVPGGTAPLVSTAIMTATLAATAGVPEIVVTTPAGADGTVNPALLLALDFAGATEIYKIGGAQAIAALAYGTESIKPVAKIFGPGNAYVVEAKRQVFGRVAVDLLPGPSEILLIADSMANPAWIAADLLAQAEHGHGSSVALVTDSAKLMAAVGDELGAQVVLLARQPHLEEVIRKNMFLIQVRSLRQAVEIANGFAPEHLTIMAKGAEKLAKEIRTAGAIFIGGWSPVVGGDFVAGPSHELPTGGAGKSFAGLTVDQFQRRTSLVRFGEKSLRKSLPIIQTFSSIEGLDAHGRSAEIRFASIRGSGRRRG